MMSKQINACHIEPRDEQAIKVVQITDTHIYKEGESGFDDFDTSKSLEAVLDAIRHADADADLVLLTGDLVHEPSDEAYQRLADHLAVLTTPVFYLPGNHDDVQKMNYVLGNNGFGQDKVVVIGHWLIVLLDTHVDGTHAGTLSEAELAFLQAYLEEYPQHAVLIALHHHPVPIHSPWMDAMALTNPAAFFSILDSHTGVKGILWGHIHQAFEHQRGGSLLMGSPSTCLQFKPGSDRFALDDKSPAYRILLLKGSGEILTEVKYLDYKID